MEATPHGDTPVPFDDFLVLAPFGSVLYGFRGFVQAHLRGEILVRHRGFLERKRSCRFRSGYPDAIGTYPSCGVGFVRERGFSTGRFPQPLFAGHVGTRRREPHPGIFPCLSEQRGA